MLCEPCSAYMGRAAVLIVALIMACSPQPVSTASSPPSTASGALALSGQLPVEQWKSANPEGAGFLDLATGAFSPDPNADLIRAGVLYKTAAQPYLLGSKNSTFAMVSYDSQVKRWLPVSRTQVAPDGLSYAYSEWLYPALDASQCPHGCMPEPTGGRIHITDVRSGQDRIAYTFTGWPMYQVVLFSPPKIYLGSECNGEYPRCNELWLFNMESDTLQSVISEAGQQWRIDGRYVWFETVDYTQLRRFDLSTGTGQTWLTQVMTDSMELLGVDATNVPWVALASMAPSPLLRVTSPGESQQVFAAAGPYSDLVTDRHGTWFAVVDNVSSTPGLYLYTKESGVIDVSSLPLLAV